MLVPAVALFASLSRTQTRPESTTLLALVAVLPAAGLTLNQFGLDGAALWSTVAAGNDPRADLTGKNIASLLVMVPLATVSAFICAAFTHGWAYLPLTLGLAPAIFGVLLGVGDVMSVRVPYAMPDRRNPLAFNPGQGCATLLAGFGALMIEAVLLAPVSRARVRADRHTVARGRDRDHRRGRERVRRHDLGGGAQHGVARGVVAAARAARRGLTPPSGLARRRSAGPGSRSMQSRERGPEVVAAKLETVDGGDESSQVRREVHVRVRREQQAEHDEEHARHPFERRTDAAQALREPR